MAISKITPGLKLKANVMVILRIFLDQKTSKSFLRKMHLNLTWCSQFLNVPPKGEGGGDSYLRHSPPPLASVIFALPPFFLSA
jgi:hypothetical protein